MVPGTCAVGHARIGFDVLIEDAGWPGAVRFSTLRSFAATGSGGRWMAGPAGHNVWLV
jgi:hypothetical protein